jgi:hypothetical protein
MEARPCVAEDAPDPTGEAFGKVEPVLQVERTAVAASVHHAGEGRHGQPAARAVDRSHGVGAVGAVGLAAAAEVDRQRRAAPLVHDVGRVAAHRFGELVAVCEVQGISRFASTVNRAHERVHDAFAEAPRVRSCDHDRQRCEGKRQGEQHRAPFDGGLSRL